jgi:hypothetical protein
MIDEDRAFVGNAHQKRAALNASNSRVANESHRFRHAQPKGLHHFQNAGKPGALIRGRLITLYLLRFDNRSRLQFRLQYRERLAVTDTQILDYTGK